MGETKWKAIAAVGTLMALILGGITLYDRWHRPADALTAVVTYGPFQLPEDFTVPPNTAVHKGIVHVLVRNEGSLNLEDVALRVPQSLYSSPASNGSTIELGTMRPRAERAVYLWTTTLPAGELLRQDMFLSHKGNQGTPTVMTPHTRDDSLTSPSFIGIAVLYVVIFFSAFWIRRRIGGTLGYVKRR